MGAARVTMKKYLALLLFVICQMAFATTYNVNPSSNLGSVFGGAGNGDTIQFSAGTYNIGSSITVPCGANVTGPPIANFIPGSNTQTAILQGNNAGYAMFVLNGGCTSQTTIQWFWFQTALSLYVNGGVSNLTYQFNSATNFSEGYNVQLDGDINATSNNINIVYNSFGDNNSCAAFMGFQDDDDCDAIENGAGVVTGLNIQNNYFYHIQEPIHIIQRCTGCQNGGIVSVCNNCTIKYNYINTFARIGMEIQTSNIGATDDFSDNIIYNPTEGNAFGMSFACCLSGRVYGSTNSTIPADFIDDNVVIFPQSSAGGPFGIEWWGLGATGRGGMIEGKIANGYAIGFFNNPSTNYGIMSDNYMCEVGAGGGPFTNEEGCGSQSCTPTNLTYPGNTNAPFIISGGNNVTSNTCSQQPSVGVNISPSSGPQSFPLTVNMSTSGRNTSIFYTTDGSTPNPGNGSTQRYTGAITVNGASTVRAVGMWGVPPQPTSWAAPYGYVPSAPTNATYTGGGAPVPTANTPTFSPGAPLTFTNSPQAVSLADSTSGAVIHYTLDGSTPTSSSATYSSALQLTGTTTVNAIAIAVGYNNSSIATGVYTYSPTVTPPPPPPPTGGGTVTVGGCQVSPNSSAGTIQNAINSAASNSCPTPSNQVYFQPGVSNIAWQPTSSALNIPCPTSAGILLTGPYTVYDQSGVLNAWSARPAATIRNSNSGASFQMLSLNGCSNQVTIQYLEIDGNKPQTGGGAIYFNGVNISNVAIEYNWIHGNQEVVPYICATDNNVADNTWCYDDERAALIDVEGYHGDQNGPGSFATNVFIQHNVEGNGPGPNGDPTTGDCGNVMTFVGGCVNSLPGCPNWNGYNNTGAFCTALFVHSDTNNFHFDYNQIIQQEQGTKWVEGGNGVDTSNPGCIPQNPNGFFCDGIYSLFFQINDTMLNNDLGIYQRIGTEDQQSSVNFNPLNGGCSLDGAGNCMWHVNNDIPGGQPNPGFGSWAFSLPNHGFHREDDNVVISNTGGGGGSTSAGPGDWEEWTYTSENNNLDQGYNACASQYGGPLPSATVSNNIFEMPNATYPSCNIAPGIDNAQSVPIPINQNNSFTTVPHTHTSASPSMSPNGGSFSGSVTVTLTDNGDASGQGPQSNTNLWCTTDGTTPAPKSGSSVYYNTGYKLTLITTTTVKCVGMWGTQNQPASYPANYGYTQSNPITATFTISGGSTPTVNAPSFTPAPPFTFSPPLTIQITQNTSGAVSHCTTDGSTPTASSPTASSVTISTTTTLSCLSTEAGFNNSSVSSGLYTVGTPVVTLVNVLTSPGGFHFTVGNTVQAIATCVYSDGSQSACPSSGPNAVSSWNTDTPTVVSISGTGLATAISIGQANVWAIAGGITGTIATMYVDTAISITSLAITTTGSITSLNVASTNQTFANCTYSNGTVNDCSALITGYTSSNPTVASINSSGLITGLAGGISSIGAFISGGSVNSSQLGVTTQDVASAVTYAGSMNMQYVFTDTAAAGYTVNSCTFYLSAGTQASGAFWDCALFKATSSTTQQAAAMCSGRYTTTGTASPAAWVTVNLTGCGTLAASQGYWLGIATNQGGPVPQGNNDCGSTCTGAAPTSVGVGTYAYFFTGVTTFGDYSNQSLTMVGQATNQSSQYLTLSTAGTSTVTAPPVSITVLGGSGLTVLQGITITGGVVR